MEKQNNYNSTIQYSYEGDNSVLLTVLQGKIQYVIQVKDRVNSLEL
jgi:hypothetical protein